MSEDTWTFEYWKTGAVGWQGKLRRFRADGRPSFGAEYRNAWTKVGLLNWADAKVIKCGGNPSCLAVTRTWGPV